MFYKFTLADEPYVKGLRSFETCVLADNNLSGKFFSSLESLTASDEIFKVTSVFFFIPDFN